MTIYNEPTEVSFDGVKFLIIPWITEDNQVDIEQAIDYALEHELVTKVDGEAMHHANKLRMQAIAVDNFKPEDI